ncbi:Pkinase-domain-containing protein [Aureobasidium subglaciale]|nr:Pkinase-domain-containing protein [Aureobasidium subglaciale]
MASALDENSRHDEELRILSRIQSTGSLLSMPPRGSMSAEAQRPRMSFDAAAIEAADLRSMTRSDSVHAHGKHARADESSISRSPTLPERESGLRRIRQSNHRQPTSPQLQTSRSPSLNLSIPAQPLAASLPSGPSSPTLPFGEDLSRFPSESLHSFSFAHQSETSLHDRQMILKRSVDFMKDRPGWGSSNPAILNAQAKITGDSEAQSMIELLQRANLLGPDGTSLQAPGLGIIGAPLSGPADPSADNIFEKSFAPLVLSESPKDFDDDLVMSPTSAKSVKSSEEKDSLQPEPKRISLKRTYTDTSGLSLQHRLADALAKPYHAADVPRRAEPLTPSQVPSGLHTSKSTTSLPVTGSASHGHGHGHGRQSAAAQAIFTTDARAPWTITAANDLACLVFGVTRAEVRKMGIMEVIRPERRKWLENKLRHPESDLYNQNKSPNHSPSSSALAKGSGVTAKLLSKPPARQTYQSRRSKTTNGIDADSTTRRVSNPSQKSRGVLLCGDVVPIQKRNGDIGSASLWVKEKQSGLIWVLEEIAEDVAYITVDEIGCVEKGVGALESIWGIERVRRGTDIRKLIPELPKLAGTNTGMLDFDQIASLRRYTARTANSISVPITVDQLSGQSTLRVSSFPHIAGILVLNPDTLKVASSNNVFSASLFGHDDPDGLPITELIPYFDSILHLLTDEDKIRLVDGLVIPEHSFRKARALLALREGRADAASIFLKPSGLPAKHRDGSDIMIDVQMRVVKSDRHSFDSIPEHNRIDADKLPASEVVYALWITYSRQLHAVNHGVGPVIPVVSRPVTPPRQPVPIRSGSSVDQDSEDSSSDKGGTAKAKIDTPSLLTQQLQQSPTQSHASGTPLLTSEPFEHPSPAAIEAGATTIKKKSIADFLILEEMGQGAYGQVKLARYKKANAQKMCIKYVTKRRILVDTWTRDRRLGTVPLEIHVLDYLRRDDLQHPNIVEMADFFEDDINYYIEMIPHGLPGMDLFDYIELRVNMEEKECRKIFVQVANALHHLHIKAKVVHRDIKDENVILDGDGAVKLVDFGSAAYIKSGPFDVFVGTIDYAAPEVLRGSPYRGKEQDVWALGILLYTIVYKENPFYSIDEIMDHDLRVPYVMSEDCIDLIRKMLDRDVERRIGIQAVLDHPWCTYVDPEDE